MSCCVMSMYAHNYNDIIIQLSPKGVVNSGRYISRDAKRLGIYMYLVLFTDPERNSCFSIYRISWIKMKKVNFVN